MGRYDKIILAYDINYVHQACENLGFPTDWEYFEDELKTYSEDEKSELYEELRDIEEYDE